MPLPKGNNKTDKTRAYQRQFAKENYKTAACNLPIAKYNEFKTIATQSGKSVSGAILAYIDLCIAAGYLARIKDSRKSE